MKIGILALQGDISELISYFERSSGGNSGNIEVVRVRKIQDLSNIDGLVIPGGESTTISRLIKLQFNGDTESFQMKIKELVNTGLPILGVCAGAVLLAKKIYNKAESTDHHAVLDVLDVSILRNAYGRQKESFETLITAPALSEQVFPAVFIRAPKIQQTGDNVEVLGYLDDTPVIVREKNLMAVTFHPELTEDYRVSKYFLEMCHERFVNR